MTDLLQHPWVQIAAWALLHFVWQGAAIALGALVALRLARTPAARYVIGVAALVLMAAAPIVTSVILMGGSGFGSGVDVPPVAGLPVGSAVVGEASIASADAITDAGLQISPQLLGFIVAGWIAGLVFFTIRLAGGWVVARRIARRAVEPAAADIQQLARALSARLGVRRVVTILQSSSINVPMVIGWIAPTIVLPIAALSGLSAAQVEALLAHELAHVRRHDYLVNLLQSVLEVVLFYHPAVWWLSRQVRADRERCCDDLAVGVCDRLVYASALGDLAALASPRVALAATDGDLLGRVRRILSREEAVMSGRSRWSVVAVLGLATAMLVPVSMISAGPAQTPKSPLTQALDDMQGVVGLLFQDQQAGAAQAEAVRRMYDELRARMAEIEKALHQALGKKHEAEEHAKVADKLKHDVADHMKQFDKMKHDSAEFAKHMEQMKHMMADEEKKFAAAIADEARMRALFSDKVTAQQREQQAALAHMFMQQHADAQKAAKSLEEARLADLAASARQLHALLEQHKAQKDVPMEHYFFKKDEPGGVPVTDENATVSSGDVLRITIAGEPDLPSAYRVGPEGTVRVPFLGPLKVLGLTAAQAREAVGKLLADRRLGSASNVQVTILRSKK